MGSADASYTGTGDDGQDYVIKTIEKTPDGPAAEWFCHELAELCGIAVPHYCELKMPGAAPAFGSRFDGSAITDKVVIMQLLQGSLPVSLLAERISAIHAFDLFVGNDDRHLGNYLFVKSIKAHAVQAFDFGRAWTERGWPISALPMPRDCNTMEYIAWLLMHHKFDHAAAAALLQRIASITPQQIKAIYANMPSKWCDRNLRNDVTRWWSTQARIQRLNQVALELKNGRYK